MARIICWDLEILHPMEPLGRNQAERWAAVKRGEAGISCLCASDSETGRMHVYDQHDLDAAVDHLNEADLLVGFNTIAFDCDVLFGVTGRYVRPEQYDILDKIWKELPIKEKGWKLDLVAQRTLNLGKSGHGEFATALAAKGHWGKLIDYCINDVHLTRLLFNHIIDTGALIAPNGDEFPMPRPPHEEYA